MTTPGQPFVLVKYYNPSPPEEAAMPPRLCLALLLAALAALQFAAAP